MKKIFLMLLPWVLIIAPAIAVLNGTAAPDGLAVSVNMIGLIALSIYCLFAGTVFFWRVLAIDVEEFENFNEQNYLDAMIWRDRLKETKNRYHFYMVVTIVVTIGISSLIGNGLYAAIYSFTEVFMIIQMERLFRAGDELYKYYEITGGRVVSLKSWNMSRMNADYDRFTSDLKDRDRMTKHLSESRTTKPRPGNSDMLDPANPHSPFSPLNPMNPMYMQSTADHSECVSRSRNDDCNTGHSGGGSSGGND